MYFKQFKQLVSKYKISAITVAAIIMVLTFISIGFNSKTNDNILVKIKRDDFNVKVKVTGEIEAEKWEEIMAPSKLRSRRIRVRNIKIQHMVPEGTIVEEGDYVASLDRSEIDNTLKDLNEEIENIRLEYQLKKLDTTSRLKAAREELKDLKFSLKETDMQLQQAKYEPPATVKQLELEKSKAQDMYERATEEYKLTREQLKTEIKKILSNLHAKKRQKADLEELLIEFEVKAPSRGMVIYTTEQQTGKKRRAGSEINPWDRTIATLPDFSSLVSKTYVNEIDIGKVKVGQDVKVQVDAYPDKYYHGHVDKIANIGESSSTNEAKVFEVMVKINDADSLMRPGMTSSNEIIVKSLEEVLLVPFEAIYRNDSVYYVHKTNQTKQIVEPIIFGETHVAIKDGLKENEEITLNEPEEHEDYKWVTD